jgi:hypothetical protein
LRKRLNNKKFWEELIACFPWYDTGHIENDASNISSVVACVFVTAVTFLPSRRLATIGGFLPSRCLATIGGFLPSRCLATIRVFLPSRCLATIGGYTDIHTHRQQRDVISVLSFFQNKESRLKIGVLHPTSVVSCCILVQIHAKWKNGLCYTHK